MANPRPRILVCDDEEGIRESVALILGDDYDLAMATNGDEAIQKIQQGDFDLVLLDIQMPRVGGLQALEWIKKTEPDLPVVMLTAYQSVEVAKQALKLGATDYIPKPFEREELLEQVKKALRSATAK
ncbi:MAG: response regulator [Candidatus Omnitrophica bacterium]|nr:response regulator [Candidatus Omnitrophota bacterium]